MRRTVVMKVRALRMCEVELAGVERLLLAGEVHEVPEIVARRLFDRGLAERAPDDAVAVPVAVAPVPVRARRTPLGRPPRLLQG